MKVLCVFGKYQYGDASRGEGTEYCAFIPALRALGHDVIHFDSWDTSSPDFVFVNRNLLEAIERHQPNVVIVVHLLFEIWTETLDILRNRGDVATISWSTDDSWKYRNFSRFMGCHYHAITTTYPNVIEKYQSDGVSNVLLTQWAASNNALKPPVSSSACKYLVSFIGAAHGNRAHQVKQLQKMGIPIECFGYGWPNGPVVASDIPEIMNKSVISLNFANSLGENQIKARVFEVCGAGGFLLTQKALGLEDFYQIGEEIDVFNDAKEAANKIRIYLNNPDLRDVMAKRAFVRTQREHTYMHRMEQVVKFALLAKSKVEAGDGVKRVDWEKTCDKHKLTITLVLLRWSLILPLATLFGRQRGRRAARRLLYELSWRISGNHTFSASGLPGRLFPGV